MNADVMHGSAAVLTDLSACTPQNRRDSLHIALDVIIDRMLELGHGLDLVRLRLTELAVERPPHKPRVAYTDRIRRISEDWP